VVLATLPATPTTPASPATTNLVTNSPAIAPAPSSPSVAIELPAPATVVAPAVPAPSSGSVTVLVNLVAPAAVNNAGIAPALLRPPSERPAETVSLPPGVLLALGAAPVGGIKEPSFVDAPAPNERILVRLPELSGSRQLQLATVAIPRTDSGTSTVYASSASASPRFEPTGLATAKFFQRIQPTTPSVLESQHGKLTTLLSQGIRQLVNSSYASALDALFGMAQWLDDTALAPKTSSFPEEIPTQDESADFEGRGSTLLPETTHVPNLSDRVLVNGLTVLATLAVARPEKKRRARIKGRRLIEDRR
jgi:hypothetical protein